MLEKSYLVFDMSTGQFEIKNNGISYLLPASAPIMGRAELCKQQGRCIGE